VDNFGTFGVDHVRKMSSVIQVMISEQCSKLSYKMFVNISRLSQYTFRKYWIKFLIAFFRNMVSDSLSVSCMIETYSNAVCIFKATLVEIAVGRTNSNKKFAMTNNLQKDTV